MAKHSKPRGPNVTHDTLVTFLDLYTAEPIMADACRALGFAGNTVHSWLAKSRAGDPAFMIYGWPHDDEPPMQFKEAILLAYKMHLLHLRDRITRDVSVGTPRVLRTPQGDIVWKKSGLLLAQWGGDTSEAREDAERIGGVLDYPYEHDESGARIPEIVFDSAPAALRVHAARALLPGWNVEDKSTRDLKVQGGVMVLDATLAPGQEALRALPAPDKIMSKLQEDLIARMRAGVKNPAPIGHVLDAVGRPVGSKLPDDPPDDVRHERPHREPQRVR